MGPDPILAQQLAGERAGLETISNICHGWMAKKFMKIVENFLVVVRQLPPTS